MDNSYLRELANELLAAAEAAKKKMTFLCTDSLARRAETPCTILKATPKRFLVRVQENCFLPGRRVKAGHEVYVPKQAISGAIPQQEPEITR